MIMLIAVCVLAILCVLLVGVLARVIYVFSRDREWRSEDDKFLMEAFRQAGWLNQWKAALKASKEVRLGFHTWADWQASARRLEQETIATPLESFPEKLSATKIAKKYNTSIAVVQQNLVQLGYVEVRAGLHYFTDLGRAVGGEWRQNPGASSVDGYMVWPADLLTNLAMKQCHASN
jgi:hypothetical protein